MKPTPETPSAVMEIASPTKKQHTQKQPSKLNTELEQDESPEDVRALQEIDRAIERCRELYRNPLLSERTQREYEHMLSELRAQGEVKMVRENIGYLMDTLRDADRYKSNFENMLQDAVEKQWISRDSRSKWRARFNDPSILEWTRKEWIDNEFPATLERWKEVAEKREEVLKLASKKNLTAKDIPELKTLQNTDAFLSLHYFARKNRVAEAKALILAHETDNTPFLRFIQKELNDWAHEGIMHSSKVGEWMERVMESGNPEVFVSSILYPFKKNWEAVRQDFDRLNTAMDAQGIPRGFRPVKADQFLLMNYKQRTSYMSLAWIRLENAEELDKKLASLKLRIRHNLDTKDYDGAQEDLDEAKKIRSDDPELRSMQEYIACHKQENIKDKHAEKKETPDPQELVNSLRTMLSQIPGDLHWMYARALEKGPSVFNRFAQVSGNHAWVVENGYASEAENIKNAQDEYNKKKTREYVERGHTQDIERNIIDGETATEDAIRDDCTQAQMLYMGSKGKEAVMEKISANADNEGFGYWTTLVPMSVSFAIHNRVIKDLHWPLKNTLRQLDRMGYRFTVSGSVQAKNTVTVQQAEEHAAQSAAAQYALAA